LDPGQSISRAGSNRRYPGPESATTRGFAAVSPDGRQKEYRREGNKQAESARARKAHAMAVPPLRCWPLFGGQDAWRDDQNKSYRWQERSSFHIPVLWTKHPGIKPESELQVWLRKARELYELSTKQATTAA
jgi:hypothetical protein